MGHITSLYRAAHKVRGHLNDVNCNQQNYASVFRIIALIAWIYLSVCLRILGCKLTLLSSVTVLSIWESKKLDDFFFDRPNNKEGNLNAVKNNYNSSLQLFPFENRSLFTSAAHMA